MKLTEEQREKLVKLIRQADINGVGQDHLIKALKGFYGKTTVSRLIREARDLTS